MSVYTTIECDRCRTSRKTQNGADWVHIVNGESERRDLCPRCYQSFTQFMENYQVSDKKESRIWRKEN